MSSSDASIHLHHNVVPLQSSLDEEESSKQLGRTPTNDYWPALLSSLSQLFASHHHHHQSLNCEGHWGTTDDFATVFSIFPCSPLPSGTCRTPGLSIPRCCLPTSSFVHLVFFPLSLCLASQSVPAPLSFLQKILQLVTS